MSGNFSDAFPWVYEEGMKRVFKETVYRIPLQPAKAARKPEKLYQEDGFSGWYTGFPVSSGALDLWRRAVDFAAGHHVNRNRAAIRLTADEAGTMGRLIALSIHLRAEGRGEYFSSLVSDLEYDHESGLGIVRLNPVFSAIQRGGR